MAQITSPEWIASMNAAEEFVAWINTDADIPEGYRFEVEVPRSNAKRVRIVMIPRGGHGRSVHAFVDLANGDLLKSASWQAPAKGARGNLITHMDNAKARFDWAGGYLYAR